MERWNINTRHRSTQAVIVSRSFLALRALSNQNNKRNKNGIHRNLSKHVNNRSHFPCTSFTYAYSYHQHNRKRISFIFPLFLHMIYDCTLLDYQSPWLSFICIVLDPTHGRSSHLRKKKESVRNECGRFMRTVLILFPYQYILLTTVFLLIQSRKINGFYLVSDISWDIMNV